MTSVYTKNIVVALFLLAGFFFAHGASALTCNDQADGNWNNTATWSCAAIPGWGDDVTIDSNVVTLTGAQSAARVTMSGGTFNMGSYTLLLSGASGGSFTYTSGNLKSGTSTLQFSCNGCGGSTFTPGTADYFNVTYAGGYSTATTVGTASVLNDFNISSSNMPLSGGTVNVKGNLTSSNNSTTVSTVFALNGPGMQAISGTFGYVTINKPSGTVNLSNTTVLTNWTWTAGNLNAGTSTLTLGQNGWGCVSFTPGNGKYYNVTSGVGFCNVNLGGNLTVTNTLAIANVGSGGDTFSTNNYAITTGNLVLSGFTLSAGSSVIKISGNMTSSGTGTFTQGTSTVILNGTNQTISGTCTFYNLYKLLPSGTSDTLTFGSGTTYTIAAGGTARFIGSRGSLLSLRSSSSGTPYTLTKTGSIVAEYVDMKDCTVSAGTTARASVNTSGNTNWTFTREFVSTIRSSGGDYTTLSAWQTAVKTSITAATTKVFSHGGITGSMPDNSAVTGFTSGATATLVHAGSTQILLKSISGTFQSGERVQIDASNYVTTSDAGFAPIATAEVYNDWSANGLSDSVTISGWTTGADNYILIVAPSGQRHQGLLKDPATGWYRGFTLKPSSSTSYGIDNQQDYTRLEGIAVDGTNITTANIRLNGTSGRADKLLSANGVTGFSLAGGAFVGNSLAYDATGKCFEDTAAATTNYTVYNSTARGCAYGFQGDNTTTAITLTNDLASGNATADFALTNSGAKSVTYSASSDATATAYGGTGNRVSQTFTFVDATGKDFHLAPKDAAARDYGTDLLPDATYPIVDDIEYELRPAIDPENMNSKTFDIGADEMTSDYSRVKNSVRLKAGTRLK